MALIESEVKQLIKNGFIPGLFRTDGTIDQFGDLVPIMEIDGYAAEFPTFSKANWPTPSFLAAGDPTVASDAKPDATNTTVDFYRLVHEFEFKDFFADAFVGGNHAVEMQVKAGRMAMFEGVAAKLVAGDNTANPKEFDGLVNLVASGNVVGANNGAANGGALTLADIDRMLHKITVNHGQACYMVSNSTVMEQFLALMRATGWQPEFREIPTLGVRAPCYRSVPLLIDDNLPSTYSKASGSNLTFLFATVLGANKGLSYIAQKGMGKDPIKVHRYRKDGTDDLVVRMTMSIGLALFQAGALAAVDGITTT